MTLRITRSTRHLLGLAAGLALLATTPAFAQESRLPEGTPLPPGAKVMPLGDLDGLRDLPLADNGLPNIMITGYWPPTNEMLRPFSPRAEQNPGLWIGANWEGRGYNVYALFPEFPNGLGKGEGDFEVDYQDTSHDFWEYADLLTPVTVISTGRAGSNYLWEFEEIHLNRFAWANDYLDPFQPTPSPPDESVPSFPPYVRHASLPMDLMLAALEDLPGLDPIIDGGTGGNFLCEFNGYHACWYADMHSAPGDPTPCLAGGHIHLGSVITPATGLTATKICLRVLTAELDTSFPLRGDFDGDEDVDAVDAAVIFVALNGADIDVPPAGCDPADFEAADIDADIDVDLHDMQLFQAAYTG
jgi:hypothetical protein